MSDFLPFLGESFNESFFADSAEQGSIPWIRGGPDLWSGHAKTEADDSFKQIKEKRDYEIQDMFGDIGGYIGLFLGYALLNIPGFFLTLSKLFKRTNKNDIGNISYDFKQ